MSALHLREIESSPDETSELNPLEVHRQQAMVVGVNTYPDGFRSLSNAVADAEEVANTLKGEYGFKLIPQNAPMLGEKASLAGLKNAVQTSLETAGRDTRWLFFYAGHGNVTNGTVYLIPADAVYGDTDTYLSLNWLLDICRDSQPVEILILLDACYSGWAMVRGEKLDDLTPSPDEIRVRQMISSGNPRQPVLDAGGESHSVFTQALLDGLQGWSGIHEPDGRVRFARLLDHLVYEIPGRLRAAGYDTFHQQPIGGYFVGNRDRREFVFYSSVNRLPPHNLRDIADQDPGRRVSGLQQISNVMASQTFDVTLSTRAIQITTQYVQSKATARQAGQFLSSIDSFKRTMHSIEPVLQVRSQAVTTLGELLQLLINQIRMVLQKNPRLADSIEDFWNKHLDTEGGLFIQGKVSVPDLSRLVDGSSVDNTSKFVEAAQKYVKPAVQLLICALEDSSEISRQAAQALSKLSLPVVAKPIQDRLNTADPALFLDLVDAIGEVGDDTITMQALKECLRQNRLAPFIGPDFPVRLTGLPDRRSIIQGLNNDHGTGESLAETAYGTMRGPSRHTFTASLRKMMDDQQLQPGEIHRALAGLKIPFWISGTYDGLLGKALNANSIIMGGDTKHWRAGRPTVVRLVGAPSNPGSLVVLEEDYKQLRENEGDRRLLLSFLREELEGKVVLFLGYDPKSPDFALLVQYVLNNHLLGTNVRAFLVWPEAGPKHVCGEHPVHELHQDVQYLVNHLA